MEKVGLGGLTTDLALIRVAWLVLRHLQDRGTAQNKRKSYKDRNYGVGLWVTGRQTHSASTDRSGMENLKDGLIQLSSGARRIRVLHPWR